MTDTIIILLLIVATVFWRHTLMGLFYVFAGIVLATDWIYRKLGKRGL